MRPDQKRIINISVPKRRFMLYYIKRVFFEFFHEKICYRRAQWIAHAHVRRTFHSIESSLMLGRRSQQPQYAVDGNFRE